MFVHKELMGMVSVLLKTTTISGTKTKFQAKAKQHRFNKQLEEEIKEI